MRTNRLLLWIVLALLIALSWLACSTHKATSQELIPAPKPREWLKDEVYEAKWVDSSHTAGESDGVVYYCRIHCYVPTTVPRNRISFIKVLADEMKYVKQFGLTFDAKKQPLDMWIDPPCIENPTIFRIYLAPPGYYKGYPR